MAKTVANGKKKPRKVKEEVHIQTGGHPPPQSMSVTLHKNARNGANRIQWINDDPNQDYIVVFPKCLFEGIRVFSNGDPPELQLDPRATPPGSGDAVFPYWILPARGRRRKSIINVKAMTKASMHRNGPVIIVSD